MKVVLASNNAHKLAELQALFSPLGLSLLAQGELGVSEAEEPHLTFIENALAKARHAAAHTGLAALADDSGLCVDALGGAPGVRSARYAAQFGLPASDAHNNQALLTQLQGVSARQARFVCALVAVRTADDPEPLVAMGRWEAQVLHEAVGQGGFGYDPLVFIPSLRCSVAELPAQVKNTHSHRALATRHMLQLMREVWFA